MKKTPSYFFRPIIAIAIIGFISKCSMQMEKKSGVLCKKQEISVRDYSCLEDLNKKKRVFYLQESFIEYIYILSFAIALFINVAITETSEIRSIALTLSTFLMLICFIELVVFIFVNKKENKFPLMILKILLISIPLFCRFLSIASFELVLGETGLTNTIQIVYASVIFIIFSLIFISITIGIHAHLSGLINKHWVSLIFCIYLLIWFVLG